MSDPDRSDPFNQETSPDATQRLSAGAPADPYITQRLDIREHLRTHSTLNVLLKPTESNPYKTQELQMPVLEAPAAPEPREAPPVAEPEQPSPVVSVARRPFNWKLPVGLGALVLLGVVAAVLITRRTEPSTRSAANGEPSSSGSVGVESVPPAAQAYLAQAKAGDTHAMHMLGVMFLYGLNVPRDSAKGLYWYRKAAEGGNEAARTELGKLEGGH